MKTIGMVVALGLLFQPLLAHGRGVVALDGEAVTEPSSPSPSLVEQEVYLSQTIERLIKERDVVESGITDAAALPACARGNICRSDGKLVCDCTQSDGTRSCPFSNFCD